MGVKTFLGLALNLSEAVFIQIRFATRKRVPRWRWQTLVLVYPEIFLLIPMNIISTFIIAARAIDGYIRLGVCLYEYVKGKKK